MTCRAKSGILYPPPPRRLYNEAGLMFDLCHLVVCGYNSLILCMAALTTPCVYQSAPMPPDIIPVS